MSDWQTAFCKTNEINQHYTRTRGNKPPLIFLHGLTGNGACWTPVAKALELEYDVIMPDARGHGKSSVPNKGYSYENLAKDLEELITSLGLFPPIIIGHSMGGMTAALVASRKQALLSGLVLADPSFLSLEVQHEVYSGDTSEQQQRFLKKSFNEVLKEAQIRQPHRSLDTIKRINKARHQTSIIPFQILKPPYPDYKQLVRDINCKSLLVTADKGIVSSAMTEELQDINQKLQMEMITGAGHGLHYDKPEKFVAVVQSFLRSNSSE